MLLASLLISTALDSCARVKLTDSPACVNMPDGSCVGDYTQHHAPFSYEKTDWDRVRVGWICEPTDWFAANKAALEKLCHETKGCIQAALSSILTRVARLREQAIQEF